MLARLQSTGHAKDIILFVSVLWIIHLLQYCSTLPFLFSDVPIPDSHGWVQVVN